MQGILKDDVLFDIDVVLFLLNALFYHCATEALWRGLGLKKQNDMHMHMHPYGTLLLKLDWLLRSRMHDSVLRQINQAVVLLPKLHTEGIE